MKKQYLEVTEPFYIIAIINIYDTSVGDTPPKYKRTDIAFNEYSDKLQVLVTADEVAGITQFYRDYPQASLCDSGCLVENPDQWTALTFTKRTSVAEDSAPIDNYLNATIKRKLLKR